MQGVKKKLASKDKSVEAHRAQASAPPDTGTIYGMLATMSHGTTPHGTAPHGTTPLGTTGHGTSSHDTATQDNTPTPRAAPSPHGIIPSGQRAHGTTSHSSHGGSAPSQGASSHGTPSHVSSSHPPSSEHCQPVPRTVFRTVPSTGWPVPQTSL